MTKRLRTLIHTLNWKNTRDGLIPKYLLMQSENKNCWWQFALDSKAKRKQLGKFWVELKIGEQHPANLSSSLNDRLSELSGPARWDLLVYWAGYHFWPLLSNREKRDFLFHNNLRLVKWARPAIPIHFNEMLTWNRCGNHPVYSDFHWYRTHRTNRNGVDQRESTCCHCRIGIPATLHGISGWFSDYSSLDAAQTRRHTFRFCDWLHVYPMVTRGFVFLHVLVPLPGNQTQVQKNQTNSSYQRGK